MSVFGNRCVLTLSLLAVMIIACGGASADSSLPSTPDGTVTYLANQVADGNAAAVWDAMPPTWQQDVNTLTHEFAAKMDPELWNKLFSILQKAVTVLQDKKDLIMATSMMEQAGENRDEIEANWDSVTTALSTLVNSELSNLDNLKTMDWGAYASGSGNQLVSQVMTMASKAAAEDDDDVNPVEALRTVSAEVLEKADDRATLRVSMEGEEPEEVEVALVEGRWVPAEMADEWDQKIAEAREGLANMSTEEMEQQKMQAMMAFGMAEAMIDQVAMAETPEQLEQMMAGLLGPMMGGGPQGQPLEVQEDQGAEGEMTE